MFIERLYIFLMFIPILTLHEFAHAWVAHKLGDDTAKDEGRLTLNPISHIDLWGTLIIPAMNIFLSAGGIGLIGWGKPVPVNLNNLNNYRRDEPIIALAGPITNLLLAFVVLAIGHWFFAHDPAISRLIGTFAYVSVFLAVFNMIPLPPLDGWNIVKHIFRMPLDLEERGGFWWLIALLVVINLPPVMNFLAFITRILLYLMESVLR